MTTVPAGILKLINSDIPLAHRQRVTDIVAAALTAQAGEFAKYVAGIEGAKRPTARETLTANNESLKR